MEIRIGDGEVVELVREIAAVTGESATDVVRRALLARRAALGHLLPEPTVFIDRRGPKRPLSPQAMDEILAPDDDFHI